MGAASEAVPAISVEACPVPPWLVVKSAGAKGCSSTVKVVVAPPWVTVSEVDAWPASVNSGT